MKKIFGKLAFAALLSIIPLSMAFALPYIITSTPGTTTAVPTANAAGTIVFNFDTSFPGSNITGSFQYRPPSLWEGVAAPPFNDTTWYLTVPWSGGLQYADIKFSGDFNYLGLYWGSIDDYNSITFYNDGSQIPELAIGGLDINPSADGSQSDPNMNRYVNIYTSFAFDQIRLTSTQYAFEVDNIAVGAIPEPATMLLFGAGIAGLAAVCRRKRS